MKKKLFSLLTVAGLASTSLFATLKDQDIFKAPENVQIALAPIGQAGNADDEFGAAEFVAQDRKFKLRPWFITQNQGEGLYSLRVEGNRHIENFGVMIDSNLPSGFVLLRLGRDQAGSSVLDMNFYDINIEDMPVIQTENNFGQVHINQQRKAEGAVVCLSVQLNHGQGHISIFNRADDRHLSTFKITRNRGYAYTKKDNGFNQRVTAAAKADYPEVQPQARRLAGVNNPHANHQNFKRALLGVMGAAPAPSLDDQAACRQALVTARQEVLDTINRYKADARIKARFKVNENVKAIDGFYLPGRNADGRHNALLAQNGIDRRANDYNALDYAYLPLGASVHDAAGGMFENLGGFMNRYSCVNGIDERGRAQQADDIFYVDQIFVRVWHLIKTYTNHEDADRTQIERELMKDTFIKNLNVMVQEGFGECNCNRGKLVQLLLALQGYYDFATFDDQADDEVEVAVNPRDAAVAFMQGINAELGRDPLAPELAVLQDIVVMMDIAPMGVDMDKISQRAYDSIIRSVNNRFERAVRTVRARFNECLAQFGLARDQLRAVTSFNVTVDQWRTALGDLIHALDAERQERIDAGTPDDDSSLGDLAAPAQAQAGGAAPVADDADDDDDLYPQDGKQKATAEDNKAKADDANDHDDQFYADLVIAFELANADQGDLDRRRREALAAHADRAEAERVRAEAERREAERAEAERREAERREQVRLIEEQLCNDMIAAAALGEQFQREAEEEARRMRQPQAGGAAGNNNRAAPAADDNDDDDDAGLYDDAPIAAASNAALHAGNDDEALAAALAMSRLAEEEDAALARVLAMTAGDDQDK